MLFSLFPSDPNIIAFHGDNTGYLDDEEWKTTSEGKFKLNFYDSSLALTEPYKFMAWRVHDWNEALNEAVESIANYIDEQLNILWSKFDSDSGTENFYIGRIKNEHPRGKLDVRSLMLQTLPKYYTFKGDKIIDKLKLDFLKFPGEFSFFPGQIFACKASFEGAEKLLVREIIDYPFTIRPFSPIVPKFERDLNFIIVSGPFNVTNENLLLKVVNYVKEYSPDYLILLGPFTDVYSNEMVKIGSLDDYFKQQMQLIETELSSTSTKVIVIPSTKDLITKAIYPTSPFSNYQSKRIIFKPNPCLLNINNVVIGITSVDILRHLTSVEFSK